MCEWCDENNGEMIGCQNCGTDICWDMKNVYVTTYGDVFCTHCGRIEQHDIDEAEEEDSYGYDFYGASWYDPDMDFENEESNGRYIGEGSEEEQS